MGEACGCIGDRPSVAPKELRPRVLVAGADAELRRIEKALYALGCPVLSAASAGAAIEEVQRKGFDRVICAVGRPSGHGLELVSAFLAEDPALEVVVVAREADFRSAVEAMERGAVEYLVAPVSSRDLCRLSESQPDWALKVHQRASEAEPMRSRASPLPESAWIPGGAFTLDALERVHVQRVLKWTGTLSEAARVLGIDRNRLRRMLARWERNGRGARASTSIK